MGAQAGTFVLRGASLMVLARLLLKEDFGLVSMATTVTGFLGLFREAGLSMATVQRASVTHEQTSTLFWVNVGLGGVLSVVTVVTAPLIAAFYGDPRLVWATVAVGTSFIFDSATVQHRAMLQRRMRVAALAAIDVGSLAFSVGAGIAMALAGHGYWALVMMMVAQPAVSVPAVWLAAAWIPGMPRRRAGVRSMLVYGGAVTLNNLVVYLAYNLDKVLIGRFWGAEALGVYGRAYQLINLPNETLNATVGRVAFPALSRIQGDPARLRSYFLKGYGLFLSLVIPLTVGCGLFADDIIVVLLGAKWRDAAAIFRPLAPTILAFALTNHFAWLMLATGQAARCLRIALLVTPVLILGYILGLPYGPWGVAVAFSATMVIAIMPVVLAATQGTSITLRDVLQAVCPASISIAIGAAATLAVWPLLRPVQPALARLVAESATLFGVYAITLLFVMKQTSVYRQLLRDTGLWPLGSQR
jgi:O-antigen/teichoic acid export membrane protein